MSTKKVLFRTIYEIRFRPTLELYSQLSSLGSELEGEYPEWQSNNNPKFIQLKNEEHKRTARLENGLISLSEESGDGSDLTKMALRIDGILLERFKIEEFQRIACRTIYIYEIDKGIPQLIEEFQKKYYKEGIKMFSEHVDSITDSSITVEVLKESMPARVTIGPMDDNEAVGRFGSLFSDNKLSDTKSYLYVDVDLWQLTPKQGDISQASRDIIKLSSELNEGLAKDF